MMQACVAEMEIRLQVEYLQLLPPAQIGIERSPSSDISSENLITRLYH